MKSAAKKKKMNFNKELNKTGGGPNLAPPLSAFEERVLGLIGEEATEGIPGGVDITAGKLTQQREMSA